MYKTSDGKEAIKLVYSYKSNGTSRDAALATDQGKKVLDGTGVKDFLNFTHGQVNDDSDDDSTGVQSGGQVYVDSDSD